MYPKFIEVHAADDGQPISVNVENILMFYPDEKSSCISFSFTGTVSYQDVTESYPEVKALIEGCGCLIHKADPRLDTAHPLTYDEMLSMPGQPVWHSNTDQWALIAEEPQYADRITVRHADGTYSNISREDTVAKPWYRMKQQTLIDALRKVRGEI